MWSTDFWIVIRFWSVLFFISAAAFPLTKSLFSTWFDRGYYFSKALGIAVVTWLVYAFGTLYIAPFTVLTIMISLGLLFVIGVFVQFFVRNTEDAPPSFTFRSLLSFSLFRQVMVFVLEELVFLALLLCWSWVKGHEPSIRGLEKFMDFGFTQTILNAMYFPTPDMWFAGGTINYYYFGHIAMAVLTKLSGIDLSITFNLMLATIFAFTATMSFSIGYQLTQMNWIPGLARNDSGKAKLKSFFSGLLTAFLVTMAGNMQTIYAFTKGYTGDDVQPFWTLLWPWTTFFASLDQGMTRYWYANATRFIPFSIHEFPSYSFVVSDLHGHVLSIPFVLLTIGVLIMMFMQKSEDGSISLKQGSQSVSSMFHLVFYGFMVGVLLMTNALDGPIYGLLFVAFILVSNVVSHLSNNGSHLKNFEIFSNQNLRRIIFPILFVVGMVAITALPFLMHFSSFASGIGVNCPPQFLANLKIGPFLFEGIEKCQKSPLWMMWLLWGFFWFTGAFLFVKTLWHTEFVRSKPFMILSVFFFFSIVLIIFPEFLYVKDIYPAHFRSNTMFKLGYQAFILWSIVSGFVISQIISNVKNQNSKLSYCARIVRFIFIVLLLPQLFLVCIYPIFSVRSYFNELRTYQGLYGLGWMEREYPEYWNVVEYIKSVTLRGNIPVIVEADGESYTDYNQISAFAGVPTIIGWGVHEWLWRGTYDNVAPRRDEVKQVYESADPVVIQSILQKYGVRYIIIGVNERKKYTTIDEEKYASFSRVVFQAGDTKVLEVGE